MTLLDVKTYLGEITDPTGQRAIDIMAAFQNHFVTNASSSYFETHDVEESSAGIESFKVSPKKPDEEWYLIFSLAANGDLSVRIDPVRYASGNQISINTSPLNSSNGNVANLDSYSSRFYIIETQDALFFLPINETNAGSTQCIHAGRIYVPFFTNDALIGLNGLGILSKRPEVYSESVGSVTPWLSDWNADERNGSLLHVSNSSTLSSRWVRAASSRKVSGSSHSNGSNALPDGKTRPSIIRLHSSTKTSNMSPTSTDSDGFNIGYLKYVFSWSNAQTAQTKLVSSVSLGPVQTLFFLSPSTATTRVVIPWETNVNSW